MGITIFAMFLNENVTTYFNYTRKRYLRKYTSKFELNNFCNWNRLYYF